VDPGVIREDLEIKEHPYSLFYQLTRLCREKGSLSHDDRLDALEIAVRRVSEGLALDAGEAREEYMEDKIYEEMQGFLGGLRESGETQVNQGFLDLSVSNL
jgi:hypothetical protein